MIENPYGQSTGWLKGTLHVHTSNSPCGHYPVKDVVDIYADSILNYDFIAITDHRVLTDISEFTNDKRIVVFSGVEYKNEYFQTLGINVNHYEDNEFDFDNHNQLFGAVSAQGGFNIICHPHIYTDDYWPTDRLLALEGYQGIEIFNNNMKMNNSGRAVATDVWDEVLSSGRVVWGFAGDDMHHFSRLGGAFLMVQTSMKTKTGIEEAVLNGRFYCSTGVYFTDLRVEAQTISVRIDPISGRSGIVRFIGNDGKLLFEESNQEMVSYHVDCQISYVRVEVIRADGAMGWSQPFFIHR